ncbi:hypothetical protein D3C87_2014380 [compost metagenome]
MKHAHPGIVDVQRLLDRSDQQAEDLPVHDRENIGEQQHTKGIAGPAAIGQ